MILAVNQIQKANFPVQVNQARYSARKVHKQQFGDDELTVMRMNTTPVKTKSYISQANFTPSLYDQIVAQTPLVKQKSKMDIVSPKKPPISAARPLRKSKVEENLRKNNADMFTRTVDLKTKLKHAEFELHSIKSAIH